MLVLAGDQHDLAHRRRPGRGAGDHATAVVELTHAVFERRAGEPTGDAHLIAAGEKDRVRRAQQLTGLHAEGATALLEVEPRHLAYAELAEQSAVSVPHLAWVAARDGGDHHRAV